MAKKEVKKALLVIKEDGGWLRGEAYIYIDGDFECMIRTILTSNAWYAVDGKRRANFLEAFGNGKLRIATVGKNVPSKGQSIRFEDVENGEWFCPSNITKNSSREDVYCMSDDVRSRIGCWGNHSTFQDVRELTDEEKQMVELYLGTFDKAKEIDCVFNVFTNLCGYCEELDYEKINEYGALLEESKNKIKRNRTSISFNTVGMFQDKEVKEKESRVKSVVESAFTLTKLLTGYQLELEKGCHLDFVEGFMSSRKYVNDDVRVMKVGTPDFSLLDVCKAIEGEVEFGGDLGLCVRKLLKKVNVCRKDVSDLGELLPVEHITTITLNAPQLEKYKDKLDKINKCVAWVYSKANILMKDFSAVLYIWDETATLFDFVDGDIDKFMEIAVKQD